MECSFSATIEIAERAEWLRESGEQELAENLAGGQPSHRIDLPMDSPPEATSSAAFARTYPGPRKAGVFFSLHSYYR